MSDTTSNTRADSEGSFGVTIGNQKRASSPIAALLTQKHGDDSERQSPQTTEEAAIENEFESKMSELVEKKIAELRHESRINSETFQEGMQYWRHASPQTHEASSPVNLEQLRIQDPPGDQTPRQVTLEQHLEEAQELLGAGSNNTGEVAKVEGPMPIVTRVLLQMPFHPLRLVQVLVQLGYEPIPPQRRFSFMFQRYMYYYPGFYGYARSIYDSEGWRGLYRGTLFVFMESVLSGAVGNMLQPIVNHSVSVIPMPFYRTETGDVPDTDPNDINSLPAILTRASRIFLRSLMTRYFVQLVVHPFHVISVCSMSQYIGKETSYMGLWSSVKEIYRTKGVTGFYSGLVPALFGHLCTCVIHSSLWLLFEIVVSNISNDMGKIVVRTFIAMPLLTYIPSTYSYPFTVMSNVMAVNNSGLAAGSPPRYPIFPSWLDCFRHLKRTGNLNRGANILFPRFAYRDIPRDPFI